MLTKSGAQVLQTTGGGKLLLTHKGSGMPWVTIESRAAIALKKAVFSGYTLKKSIRAVVQKKKGSWHVGDVMRVKLDIDAQSDMTWVVVSDPIPGGATILGRGLGGDSIRLTKDERPARVPEVLLEIQHRGSKVVVGQHKHATLLGVWAQVQADHAPRPALSPGRQHGRGHGCQTSIFLLV